jgi:hypothetical protein
MPALKSILVAFTAVFTFLPAAFAVQDSDTNEVQPLGGNLPSARILQEAAQAIKFSSSLERNVEQSREYNFGLADYILGRGR